MLGNADTEYTQKEHVLSMKLQAADSATAHLLLVTDAALLREISSRRTFSQLL
jgi:hypothetical protein